MESETNKNDIAIAVITIFFIGVVAGAGWGIGTQTKLDPDDDGWTSLLASKACGMVQSADGTGQVEKSCSNIIYLFTILSIFAGLVSIFSYIKLVGDWKIGIVIYVISWLFGYLYITSTWFNSIFG